MSDLPLHPPAPPEPTPAHEATGNVGPDSRVPTKRRRLLFFDRVKVLTIIAVVLAFATAKKHADIPIMSWRDAIDDQLRAKRWLLVVAGLEIVRQFHYVLSERSERWHAFWMKKVWGRWDRFTQRRDPWMRYRFGRIIRWLFWITLLAFILGWRWGLSPVQALVEAPGRLWDEAFAPTSGIGFLPYVVFIVGIAILQFAAIFWFMSKGGVDTYMPDEIRTRFSDVWGQDHVLERVKENIVFLDQPDELERRGGHIPGGILLWGPPGTGKTLMAEAVAGETGRPYVFVDPGAFANMFFGVGILKVKSLFRRLRKLALRYGGVIVFFDEADSLGNRGGAVSGMHANGDAVFGVDGCRGGAYLSDHARSHVLESYLADASSEPAPRRGGILRIIAPGMMGRGGMGELQVLLSELSGLKKPRGFFNRRVRHFFTMPPKPPPKYRILLIMATNMPDSLDPALLRPGRVDRIYKVGYPSKEGRRRTYEGYFSRIKHNVSLQLIEKLATITPYATGASIKDLVNESLIVAMRHGRDFVTWPDVVEAKKLKMVGPGENVDYIERERHAVAIHEACHAVMSYRVQKGHDIDVATIEKGQDFLGFVAPIPLEERFTAWRSTYEADVMVSLASLAGERIFFDADNSSGVSGDLMSATRITIAMDGYWGMGITIASHAVAGGRSDATALVVKEKDMLRGEFGQRVEQRLRELFERTQRVIEENRFEVLAVAHALETHRTITGDDIGAIIDGYPGPLVDGRPYHLAAFIGVAEEYHRRAVVAHKNQSRIDVPLPAFDAAHPFAGVRADSTRWTWTAWGTTGGPNSSSI